MLKLEHFFREQWKPILDNTGRNCCSDNQNTTLGSRGDLNVVANRMNSIEPLRTSSSDSTFEKSEIIINSKMVDFSVIFPKNIPAGSGMWDS